MTRSTSTATTISPPDESGAEAKHPLDPEAERRHELFQHELASQNEKHMVSFITAICLAVIAYIGYDYVTLPALWHRMVLWRIADILCGIAVIALLSYKRISARVRLFSRNAAMNGLA